MSWLLYRIYRLLLKGIAMKYIECPNCNKQTKVHSDNRTGLRFVYKYQVCLKCERAYFINADNTTSIIKSK